MRSGAGGVLGPLTRLSRVIGITELKNIKFKLEKPSTSHLI